MGETMSVEKICVVGCSGFVGSHVTAELLSRGYDVNGTLRDAEGENSSWLLSDVAAYSGDSNNLTLFAADVFDKDSIRQAMENCSGVIVCAGSPLVVPETIDLMIAVAENVSDMAIDANITRAVFTSSTGSTNPMEGEPLLKNENLHWSNPNYQLAGKKYAAVGKTLLDQKVLNKMANAREKFRVCVINPSMIVGPAFQRDPVVSLCRFAAIINGKRFSEKIPNSSNSIIDVRDLAKLHVNALEKEEAKGRYFGVKQSWHWRDILKALEVACDKYTMPQIDPYETPVPATQFDFSRQDTLGVKLRNIDEMFASLVAELNRRSMI
jgi:nucleoside-diphosphate-sugar epimerase